SPLRYDQLIKGIVSVVGVGSDVETLEKSTGSSRLLRVVNSVCNVAYRIVGVLDVLKRERTGAARSEPLRLDAVRAKSLRAEAVCHLNIVAEPCARALSARVEV